MQGVRVVVDGAEIAGAGARGRERDRRVVRQRARARRRARTPTRSGPAKGVHITVPWAKVRNDIAAVIPVPKDRRSVFVVPWGDFTYIGTTDTDYDGPLDDPQCTPDDIAYLLRAINGAVTTPLTETDILGTWAGLRPLVKDAGSERTADLSRRHSVTTSASGVVTVTGGKLTTYRRMAADTVDAVARSLGVKGRSRTARLPLSGARGLGRRRALGAPRRAATAATAARSARLDRGAAGAGRADRARARLLEGRGRVRGARRDGAQRRRRARAPHPRAAARARRVGRCRGRGRPAHRADPRVDRRRPGSVGRPRTGPSSTPNARPRSSPRPRSTRPSEPDRAPTRGADAVHSRTRRTDASDRARRRGDGDRAARAARASRSTTRCSRRLRDACADGQHRRRDAQRVEPRLVAARDALGARARGARAARARSPARPTPTRSRRCCASARRPRSR